jgi:hypothetical protein
MRRVAFRKRLLEKENLEVVKEKEVLRNIIDYAGQLSCA